MNDTFCQNVATDAAGINSLNGSFNSSDLEPDPPGVCLALLPPTTPYSPIVTTLMVAIMSPVILLTVVGNCLVIYACVTDSKLRRPHHWFLVSLAASDLTVGLLVMPFALVNEVQGSWPFGAVWCEIHVTVDVLACTASIYNLCAIALDRYWCSTRMNYARLQSSTRVGGLILAVWVLALSVCLPPLMGWGREHGMEDGMCGLSSFSPYVVLSSTLSFFIPLVVMVTLNVMTLYSHRARNKWRRTLGKAYSCSTVTNTTFKSRNLSAEDGEISPTKKKEKVCTSDDTGVSGGECAAPDSPTPKSSPKMFTIVPTKPTDECLRTAGDTDRKEKKPTSPTFLTLHGTNRLSAPNCGIERSMSGSDIFHSTASDHLNDDELEVEPPKTSPMLRRRKEGTSQPEEAFNLPFSLCPADLTARWYAKTRQNPDTPPQKTRTLFGGGHNCSPMRQCPIQRRERRFVFIISVVMITFTLCWLPFFAFYVLCVLWWSCFPRWLFVLSVWLGYCNSVFNPAIYAIWNDTIREAFKKALCSKSPRNANMPS